VCCARRLAISAICCTILLCGITAYADTHWANPAGSNVPPYTSYATGAHYLQDAVAAASDGDSIRVAAGLYDVDTTIYIPSNVVWAGVGRDSVVLYWIDFEYRPGRLAELGKNVKISGIEFNFPKGSGFNQAIDGIYVYQPETLIIFNCRFRQCTADVQGSGTFEVYNTEFHFGITYGIYAGATEGWIHHNSFFGKRSGDGIHCMLAGLVVIEHNLFEGEPTSSPDAVDIFYATFVEIRNNVILNSADPVSWQYASGIVENNTMITAIGIPGGVIPHNAIRVFLRSHESVIIRNNAMIDFTAPWEFGPECSTCSPTGLITFVHNTFWPSKDIHYQLEPDMPPQLINLLDSANFEAYPMFADDSLYRLQRGSPLVDAGDPLVLDLDGSRSDIGRSGGPGGDIYEYPEMAPDAPDSIWAEASDGIVALTWSTRPEADLAGYRLYRDEYSGFSPDAGNFLAETGIFDTSYSDTIHGLGGEFYYVVTAIDTAGLESDPSPEGIIIETGVFDDPEDAQVPSTPKIIAAYPNPFNTSTVMEVYIPRIGAMPVTVEIPIYNILGQHVATAYDGKLDSGVHQIEWNGSLHSGRSAPSGLYFALLRAGGSTFGPPTKLIMLK